jgi:hypothetical protein
VRRCGADASAAAWLCGVGVGYVMCVCRHMNMYLFAFVNEIG